MTLRELIRESGLRQCEVAELIGCDRSMLSYINGGGRPSYQMACSIAFVISTANPRLEMSVFLWMLRLGFAPPVLRDASEERQRECLVNVGVPAE